MSHAEKYELAVYGHTMVTYKGNAYVYGGIKLESPSNELIQINLKNLSSNQLNCAPFRRRDHAATFLARFMVIHGGI